MQRLQTFMHILTGSQVTDVKHAHERSSFIAVSQDTDRLKIEVEIETANLKESKRHRWTRKEGTIASSAKLFNLKYDALNLPAFPNLHSLHSFSDLKIYNFVPKKHLNFFEIEIIIFLWPHQLISCPWITSAMRKWASICPRGVSSCDTEEPVIEVMWYALLISNTRSYKANRLPYFDICMCMWLIYAYRLA